jgi:hypothetical protein
MLLVLGTVHGGPLGVRGAEPARLVLEHERRRKMQVHHAQGGRLEDEVGAVATRDQPKLDLIPCFVQRVLIRDIRRRAAPILRGQ